MQVIIQRESALVPGAGDGDFWGADYLTHDVPLGLLDPTLATKGRGRGYWAPHVGREGGTGSSPRGGLGAQESNRSRPKPTAGQMTLLSDEATTNSAAYNPRDHAIAGAAIYPDAEAARLDIISDPQIIALERRMAILRQDAVTVAGVLADLHAARGKGGFSPEQQVLFATETKEATKIAERLEQANAKLILAVADYLRAKDPAPFKLQFSNDFRYPLSDMWDPDARRAVELLCTDSLKAVMGTVSRNTLTDFDMTTGGLRRGVLVGLMNIGGGSWYSARDSQPPRGAGRIHLGAAGYVMGDQDGGKLRGALIHEFGHWLEDRSTDIAEQVNAYHEKRSGTNSIQYDSQRQEYRRKDAFLDGYMERVYPDRHGSDAYTTEAFSMGMEMLFTEPSRLAQDPELFDLVVWALTDLPRKRT